MQCRPSEGGPPARSLCQGVVRWFGRACAGVVGRACKSFSCSAVESTAALRVQPIHSADDGDALPSPAWIDLQIGITSCDSQRGRAGKSQGSSAHARDNFADSIATASCCQQHRHSLQPGELRIPSDCNAIGRAPSQWAYERRGGRRSSGDLHNTLKLTHVAQWHCTGSAF